MSVSPPCETRAVRASVSFSALRATAAAFVFAQLSLAQPAAADEPPAAPTAPAPTSTAPPPAVTAPPAAPTAPPSSDSNAETPTPPPRPTAQLLPWAGALFQWYHHVSLPGGADVTPVGTLAPVGNESDSYSQSFSFSGGYFIFRRAPHQLRVSTNVTVTTELTNSDSTTKKRESLVNDIPLQLTYTPTLFSTGDGGPTKGAAAMRAPTLLGTGDHKTWGVVSGAIHFPTSGQSQGSGLTLTTSLGLGARQQIKLLGSDAPGLTHVILGFRETWSHFFYRATTATNAELERPRQTPSGDVISSDQLSGNPTIENQLGTTFYFVLPLVGGLQLDSSFSYFHEIPHQLKGSECDVQVSTGCVDLPQSQVKVRESTSFDIGLSYLIVPELAIDIGYQNSASTLDERGTSRNPFVSPNALFYAGLTISFDRFYQRFAEPDNLAALLGKAKSPTN